MRCARIKKVPAMLSRSRIVVAHDDGIVLAAIAGTLRACGHQVATFSAPMPAWDLISTVGRVSALVTRVRFASGGPNGVALGRWTQMNHDSARIFYIGPPEMAEFIVGAGMLLSPDLSPGDAARLVAEILETKAGYRPVVPTAA
jgi:hypothetical protein